MDADLIIIGSGIGGATLAAALAPSGQKILILEKGERLLPAPEARDDVAIFRRGHYAPTETWMGSDGTPFVAGNYYVVGGNSKFFGAVMYRYRETDFQPRAHLQGASPGWPMSYAELEPWYGRAEALYKVRGTAGEDPTEPPHSTAYGFPPVPDEPVMQKVRARLAKAGAHPSSLPLAIDIDSWLAEGKTGWDAFPNTGKGKIDAESGPLTEALAHPNVRLRTGAEVLRLETDASGHRVVAAIVRAGGREERLTARAFAVAAGAIQSAALLLRSANAAHPAGLANGSDQVGRNFMNHNSSAMLTIDPRLRNTSVYQKTISFNDFYDADPETGRPLGNVQGLGRITAPILKANMPLLPMPLARLVAGYAFGWFLQSEDLPNPESRVMVQDGQIVMHWQRSNMAAHQALIARTKAVMKRAGFPIVLVHTFGRKTTSHQCGTARLGDDPARSVVNPELRAHQIRNMWIADASVLPTSAAVNPALTVAALVLRAAESVKRFLKDAA
ncbi:GMC oxidoreductase [Tabrizicola oligotrophica]|uniref:GMC family oxidoreductase n=1 Tax=Tabrizicola oligotrophica TaxID=2710650 RepID=A0A6M0QX41_9RHOB|nr:GMC family oxidoreductase [Tabrizicola oligotrophica]NEY92068.1 GMC family oxidoreductase [Tabrizicola oligotrophica]